MIEEAKLPQGWFVVTSHYPHGELTGTLLEKGEARVLVFVSEKPHDIPAEPLTTDEGPLPVASLAEGFGAEELKKALDPHDLDPRVHGRG